MIKWYDTTVSENELWNIIYRNLKSGFDKVAITEWLMKGIKSVAFSHEENVFQVTYRPYLVLDDLRYCEGATEIKFVKARGYVDAQDQVLKTTNCRILNIMKVEDQI